MTVAGAAAAILFLVALFLAAEAWPALWAIGPAAFLTDPSWHPAEGADHGSFNLAPMLAASLAATVGALLPAVPLGLASALFSRFYAPPAVASTYRRILQLLAGIPSVVYGFWGLVVLAPLIRQWQPPGQSLLAGSLILALMILPTVALLSESSLRAVPASFLAGAAALGLSRWATIRAAVLPAARRGIITSILLAGGRAIGETMAVLMVAGNVIRWPESPFDPVRLLTANIALELGYALDLHRAALFVCGLVLLGAVVCLVAAADWLAREQVHG